MSAPPLEREASGSPLEGGGIKLPPVINFNLKSNHFHKILKLLFRIQKSFIFDQTGRCAARAGLTPETF
jgi:hypothetical protein